jgi:ATP-dependent DNA helicase PIF1
MLMEGGRAAHSTLRLPLGIYRQENPTCNISRASGRPQVFRTYKLIIWDECTMARRKAFEALDVTLKDLRGNKNLMGAALILLCGHFRQTLSVVPKPTLADKIHACLKHSFLWRHVKYYFNAKHESTSEG